MAPPSLRTVQQESFAECGRLRRVVLNEDLKKLDSEDGEGVFHDSALEEVVLPSTLLQIEDDAFCKCRSLKHVTLPDALEELSAYCFRASGLQ